MRPSGPNGHVTPGDLVITCDERILLMWATSDEAPDEKWTTDLKECTVLDSDVLCTVIAVKHVNDATYFMVITGSRIGWLRNYIVRPLVTTLAHPDDAFVRDRYDPMDDEWVT